jgi:hypothetical protein
MVTIYTTDLNTRWFKYDRDYLCVNKSQFVPVIFEPPCNYTIESVRKTQQCILSAVPLHFTVNYFV